MEVGLWIRRKAEWETGCASCSPASPDQRILYTVLECQPLFDSSDMTITEWVQIAQTIERHYTQYQGFVVIHGTDTMAFAASGLSFMLENLQKPVVLTGAQVPIHALWSDGRENLLGALLMAGQYIIPEVCLFFQNKLFQGNRTTKVDAQRFEAFCSPNFSPLATVGADVTISRELVRKASGKDHLVVHNSMERDVGLLCLYPGIPASLVRTFLQSPLKGVVMETFGSGNGPTKPDLLQELRVASEQGLIIVNCTHGEMTLPITDDHQSLLQDGMLGCRVAKLLSLTGSQEADAIQDVLMSSLALAAAHAGDLDSLQAFVDLGRDLNLKDCSGQIPLHVAGRRGHATVVTLLLQQGVDVNAHNEDGHSPLLLAVRVRHQGVIGLLRAAGAYLSPQELEDIGTELCRLASRADSKGLRAWWQAGADLEQMGYDGHCALQAVEAYGNADVVALLQSF
ncbi:hypothetical protein STEG23_001993 [Scotinomys teguina]